MKVPSSLPIKQYKYVPCSHCVNSRDSDCSYCGGIRLKGIEASSKDAIASPSEIVISEAAKTLRLLREFHPQAFKMTTSLQAAVIKAQGSDPLIAAAPEMLRVLKEELLDIGAALYEPDKYLQGLKITIARFEKVIAFAEGGDL